jgi:sarcosine oxidase
LRSLDLWKYIENKSDEKLLYQTGGLDAGKTSGNFFQTALESCQTHNLSYEVIEGANLQKRFPAFTLPEDYSGLFQPDAGLLIPERCITTFVNLAFEAGAEIHANEEVLEWKEKDGGIVVKTNRDTYRADRLIITAGAWTSKFLPMLSKLLVVERAVAAWFQPLNPALFKLGKMPIFIIEDRNNGCYGFPMFGHPGFRVGTFRDLNPETLPDEINRNVGNEDLEHIRYFVEKFLPKGNGEVVATETCLYTNSPDEHFIIDFHPEVPQVSFAAGFTGYGFKFCPVIGEIMADLATEGGTSHNIADFSLNRFNM